MSQPISKQTTLGSRAHAIYDRDLKPVVETEANIGKMLVLDVDQVEYEIDTEGSTALKRLRARCPEMTSQSTFAFRIGYDAAYGVGATISRTSK